MVLEAYLWWPKYEPFFPNQGWISSYIPLIMGAHTKGRQLLRHVWLGLVPSQSAAGTNRQGYISTVYSSAGVAKCWFMLVALSVWAEVVGKNGQAALSASCSSILPWPVDEQHFFHVILLYITWEKEEKVF